MRKTTKKKIAPIVITVLVVLAAAPLAAVMTLAALGVVVYASFGAALVMLVCGAFGGAVVVGIVKALLQRLDEIDGGEEEAASRY